MEQPQPSEWMAQKSPPKRWMLKFPFINASKRRESNLSGLQSHTRVNVYIRQSSWSYTPSQLPFFSTTMLNIHHFNHHQPLSSASEHRGLSYPIKLFRNFRYDCIGKFQIPRLRRWGTYCTYLSIILNMHCLPMALMGVKIINTVSWRTIPTGPRRTFYDTTPIKKWRRDQMGTYLWRLHFLISRHNPFPPPFFLLPTYRWSESMLAWLLNNRLYPPPRLSLLRLSAACWAVMLALLVTLLACTLGTVLGTATPDLALGQGSRVTIQDCTPNMPPCPVNAAPQDLLLRADDMPT
jgi:hypothetical protein